MSTVNLPKSWATGETPKAADVNADFAAITAQVNGNLDNTNIRAGAGITGDKIANNTLTGANIASNANILGSQLSPTAGITGAQLAAGAAVHGKVTAAASAGVYTAEAAAVTLPAITTRGGTILLFGQVNWWTVLSSASTSDITVRVRRDGTLLFATTYTLANTTGAGLFTFPIPTPQVVDVQSAGTYVYTVTVAVTGAGGGNVTVGATNPGSYWAMELS